MPPQIQTSFIPKESLAPVPVRSVTPLSSLLSVLAVIIFILACLSWGGVYLYAQSLQKQITELESSLNLKSEEFQQSTLERFEKLDRLVRVSQQLIDRHTTLVPLFNLLEERSLTDVRFKSFQYSIGTGSGAGSSVAGNKEISVHLSGEAKSYTAVAQQSDLLGDKNHELKDGILTNVIFSNLNLDQTGNVTFDVSFLVNPKLLSYKTPINPFKK